MRLREGGGGVGSAVCRFHGKGASIQAEAVCVEAPLSELVPCLQEGSRAGSRLGLAFGRPLPCLTYSQRLLAAASQRCGLDLCLEKCAGCGQVLPADLEDAVQGFPRWAKMLQGHGGALLIQLALKYGPARSQFEQQWLRNGCFGCPVEQLYRVLVDTAHALDSVSMSAWTLNCGRQVSHHSGWLPLLIRLGILRRASRSTRSRPPRLQVSRQQLHHKVLRLGEMGQLYQTRPLKGPLRRKLRSYVDAGTAIVGTAAVPRTCADWCAQVENFMAAARKHMLASSRAGSGAYYLCWLARTFLVALMRSHGVAGLGMTGLTEASLQQLGPDQGGWIPKLCSRSGAVQSLRSLGYSKAPEVFSMYACLFNDPQLASVCPASLRQRVAALRRRLSSYRQVHGVTPHPVVLLKEDGVLD